jgi:uncharacterized protein (TIGR02145 family)
MKSIFSPFKLLMLGLSVFFATSCNDKEKEELTPKAIEECAFFTAKYSKAQVWEVEFDGSRDYNFSFQVGKAVDLNIVGPARTLNSMSNEGMPISWGSNNDRYFQFKLVEGYGFVEMIDDIKNEEESGIKLVPQLFEKNAIMSEDYNSKLDPCIVAAINADGYIVRFRSTEEFYYLYFSKKALSNPTNISIKPTKAEIMKISNLVDERVETQLDKLNKILPTVGGVSNVVFKPGATYGTMTDLNGNTYKTITIGTQTWMAENLRTTKYRNSESISIVNIGVEWGFREKEALCSHMNTMDKNKIATDGLLYNAYAIKDSRNIAPQGWRVPTVEDWEKLITQLGGKDLASNKLKEAGTLHWSETTTKVTNESGFSAIATGGRSYDYDGRFYKNNGYNTTFATSVDYSDDKTNIWVYRLFSDLDMVEKGYEKKSEGISVRLIKE